MHVLSYNKPPADTALIACPDCDLLQRLPELAPGASTRCGRCDLELGRRPADSRNRTLALTVAAAILWIAANSVPMLGLSVIGHQASTTVFGGAQPGDRSHQRGHRRGDPCAGIDLSRAVRELPVELARPAVQGPGLELT